MQVLIRSLPVRATDSRRGSRADFSKQFARGDLNTGTPDPIPHRFQEKGNLEVLLFTIQSRMRANNQKVYTPHDGKLVSDINRVLWQFQLSF